MKKVDERSIEHTRDEAQRLLDEIERKPTSSGAEITVPSQFSVNPQEPSLKAGHPSVPMSWLMLASLVFGAMVSAMVMALFFRPLNTSYRSQAVNGTFSPWSDPAPVLKTESRPSASSPTSVLPQRDVPSNTQNPEFQSPSPPATGAWGPASAYKFGRLPDATYPDSCAFSQTDSAAQTIISRSDVDYWACRDEGGNPSDGFNVVWADGKRTTYSFGSGGGGSVVGTNGQTYPIRWRNDSRNGTNVIIISHSDGATSWIPGRVN
jgi:hypothetical protein